MKRTKFTLEEEIEMIISGRFTHNLAKRVIFLRGMETPELVEECNDLIKCTDSDLKRDSWMLIESMARQIIPRTYSFSRYRGSMWDVDSLVNEVVVQFHNLQHLLPSYEEGEIYPRVKGGSTGFLVVAHIVSHEVRRIVNAAISQDRRETQGRCKATEELTNAKVAGKRFPPDGALAGQTGREDIPAAPTKLEERGFERVPDDVALGGSSALGQLQDLMKGATA